MIVKRTPRSTTVPLAAVRGRTVSDSVDSVTSRPATIRLPYRANIVPDWATSTQCQKGGSALIAGGDARSYSGSLGLFHLRLTQAALP